MVISIPKIPQQQWLDSSKTISPHQFSSLRVFQKDFFRSWDSGLCQWSCWSLFGGPWWAEFGWIRLGCGGKKWAFRGRFRLESLGVRLRDPSLEDFFLIKTGEPLLGTNISCISLTVWHFWVDDFPNFPFGGICYIGYIVPWRVCNFIQHSYIKLYPLVHGEGREKTHCIETAIHPYL